MTAADRIRREIKKLGKLWNGGFEDMQALEQKVPGVLKAMAAMVNALDRSSLYNLYNRKPDNEAALALAEAAKLLCGEEK